jgi:hypothetical protein
VVEAQLSVTSGNQQLFLGHGDVTTLFVPFDDGDVAGALVGQ